MRLSKAGPHRDISTQGCRSEPELMTSRPGATIGCLLAAAVIGLTRAAFLVVRVDGDSMTPDYRPGDTVLTARRWVTGPARPGDVVICRLPRGVPGPGGYLIKRVTSVAAGQVTLRGDGENSYDSRAFGPVPQDCVLGRVITRLSTTRRHVLARECLDPPRLPERTA